MTWLVEKRSIEPQETRVDSGLVEQCPPQFGLKCSKVHDLLENSCRVVEVVLVAQFSTTCTAMSV